MLLFGGVVGTTESHEKLNKSPEKALWDLKTTNSGRIITRIFVGDVFLGLGKLGVNCTLIPTIR